MSRCSHNWVKKNSDDPDPTNDTVLKCTICSIEDTFVWQNKEKHE